VVTTTLLDVPVSCISCPELTKCLDAPDSNMACVIASSIVLASSCLNAQSTFCCSSCCAQRCADAAMDLGPELTTDVPVHCEVEDQIQRQPGKGRIAFLV
jgi:hypothetical protein